MNDIEFRITLVPSKELLMTDRSLSIKSGKQEQSLSNVETFTFRVEPSSIPIFITKLCLMLDDDSLGELISWSNDGKRFCVFDIPGFSKVLLPQYFKHSNWPSFVRQLNMYGFHKVNDNFSARHGQLICEFHHPLFYRNGRQALRKIRRNSRKSILAIGDSQTQQHRQQEQQQQQHPDRQYQKQSSPPHQPISCSSMPISSLLSSNDNNYPDDNTVTFLNSTINNDTLDADDTRNDHHNTTNRNFIDDKIRSMTDNNNNDKSTIGDTHPTIENNTDTSNNINSDFCDYGDYSINKNKGKHTARTENGDDDASQDKKIDGPKSITPLAQQYTDMRQQLDQLQSNTITLNSEMSFLKRYVAKQQESLIDLLNYLSVIVEHSDRPGFKYQQHHQEALKALQIRNEQGFLYVAKGKRHNNNNKSHFYHHHHYRHNEHVDDLDNITYFDDSNQTKKSTTNTIHEPKQSTESAEKDHHMHIHPLDNKKSINLDPLPLDTNKNDTNHDHRLNLNYRNNDGNESSATTATISPSN